MYDGSSGTYLDIDTETANGAVILRASARSGAYPPLLFTVGNAERVRIDASGNVGIGTSSPSYPLVIGDGTDSTEYLSIESSTTGTAGILFGDTTPARGGILYDNSNNSMAFRTGANTEAMRIDSSGNLLVGKTSVGVSVVGVEARGNGLLVATRDDDIVGLFNRSTGDGSIVEFRKDNTRVGSIGAKSGDIYIGTGDTGIRFNDTDNAVYAADTTTGSASDGNISLGVSSARWKDLYLSGTANVGSVNIDQNNAFTNTNITSANNNTDKGNFLRFMQVASGSIPAPDFFIGHAGDNSGDAVLLNASSSSMKFYTNNTEKVRIDASGNLLVGTTAVSLYNSSSETGSRIGDGVLMVTRSGLTPAYFNRLTSDGDILDFRKNGAAVGSIGTTNSDLTIGTGDVGFRFRDGSNDILPFDVGSNSATDGVVSFGDASVRWKDLYLSGGTLTGSFSNTGVSEGQKISSSGRLTESSADATTTKVHRAFYNPNGQVGTISTNASATAYNTSSDQRLKENIADADDAGSKVDAIQVRQFDWKADGSHQDYGMIAQELAVVAPEAVSVPENPEDMMGVDYSKLVPMLIKEIQSLRNRVATLEGN